MRRPQRLLRRLERRLGTWADRLENASYTCLDCANEDGPEAGVHSPVADCELGGNEGCPRPFEHHPWRPAWWARRVTEAEWRDRSGW